MCSRARQGVLACAPGCVCARLRASVHVCARVHSCARQRAGVRVRASVRACVCLSELVNIPSATLPDFSPVFYFCFA